MEHTKAISYFKIFCFAAFFSDDWSTVFLPYFKKKEKKNFSLQLNMLKRRHASF